jgi:hypothetical protein
VQVKNALRQARSDFRKSLLGRQLIRSCVFTHVLIPLLVIRLQVPLLKSGQVE